MPKKYRQLWKWDKSDQVDIESNWSDSLAFESPLEETASTISDALLEKQIELEPDESAQETAAAVRETLELDEGEKQELSSLEEQILQAIVLPKRWWYNGGCALARIRSLRLYRETHSDFHQYCLYRFNKTRRHIDRWIAAAAALDNLTESGCTVLPTAESVLRPIASLPPSQQVEVWSRAVEAAGSCPTANLVEEIRDEFLGKTPHSPIENEQAEPAAQINWSKSDSPESLEVAQARNLVRRLPLTEMESLYFWLGELIESLKRGDF